MSIARRRAAFAKRGLVFGSAVAFAATVGLAASGHPASTAATVPTATTTPTTSTSPSSEVTSGDTGFGQADVAPDTSSQTPSVSTGAS